MTTRIATDARAAYFASVIDHLTLMARDTIGDPAGLDRVEVDYVRDADGPAYLKVVGLRTATGRAVDFAAHRRSCQDPSCPCGLDDALTGALDPVIAAHHDVLADPRYEMAGIPLTA